MDQLPKVKRFWYKHLFLCISFCMWVGLSVTCWLGLYLIMLTYGISEFAIKHWYMPVLYALVFAAWPAGHLTAWVTHDMANRMKFPKEILFDWYRQAAKNLKLNNGQADITMVLYTAGRIRVGAPTDASSTYTIIAAIVAYERAGHLKKIPSALVTHVNDYPDIYLAFKGMPK